MSANVIGLGPGEASLLSWAAREERQRLTTDEVARQFGQTRAHQLLSSLAAKGLVTRVSQGIYLVRDIEALGTRRTPTSLALVGLLLAETDYYAGGRTAASHHHLTTQRYFAVLDVYSTHRLHPRRLGAAQLVPHPMPAAGSATGTTTVRIQDVDVRISDPERTVVDLVDRVERLLGWSETEQVIADAVGTRRVDFDRLIRYAAEWPKHSTAARIAVLLERNGLSDERLAPLIERFREYEGSTALVPGNARRGSWHTRFRVILNDSSPARR